MTNLDNLHRPIDVTDYGFALRTAAHDDIAASYLLPGDFVTIHLTDDLTGDAEALWCRILYTETDASARRTYEVALTEPPRLLPLVFGNVLAISACHVLDWTEEPASSTA